MRSSFLFAVVLFIGFTLSGCWFYDCDLSPNTNVNQEQLDKDIEKIEAYLENNNIQAQVHSSGIRYVVNDSGNGDKPDLCNSVSVTYEGRLMSNGGVFDRATSDITFGLSRLVTGWQIGLPLIEEGGTIILYVPSVYGYGSSGVEATIPPNANLIFEVNLKDVF